MKRIILMMLLLLSNQAIAQIKNGETLPDIHFTKLLNANEPELNLSQLRGKIVLLEFWATWCGSCIAAMPHLKKLQKTYADKIQIITVTDESEKRIAAYLKSKPSNLWFAIDTSGNIGKMFPHQLIPHTVLISAEGALLSNTQPEAVTAAVIDSLLNHKTANLPEKKDVIHKSHEELIASIFPSDSQTKERFMMQKEITGAGGFSTTYLSDSQYRGKRITAINLGISSLYRLAYPDFSFKRVIDQTQDADQESGYCLDLIVSNEKDLLPTLRKELLKRFDIQVKTEKRWKEVAVLKIKDQEKFKNIKKNTTGTRTYYSRHGEIDQQAITMSDFASYLEDFGTGKYLVRDATNVKSRFDIKFSFEPENPSSLTRILADMGLVLEKQKQAIEMLVIYKL